MGFRRASTAGKAPGDLRTAIANTRSRIALITSANELEDILTKPFAAWRTFLHPSQWRVSLRSLGINVSGRSSRLRINYRSTQEILAWATSVLTGSEVDELDGGVATRAREALHISWHGPRSPLLPPGT